jgi:hypothetical protein
MSKLSRRIALWSLVLLAALGPLVAASAPPPAPDADNAGGASEISTWLEGRACAAEATPVLPATSGIDPALCGNCPNCSSDNTCFGKLPGRRCAADNLHSCQVFDGCALSNCCRCTQL